MNQSARRLFSVPRVVLPILVVFCAVGALAIPAIGEQEDEAKVQACWDVMRQYARCLNKGDSAAAYRLLAPPVQDLITEREFRETVTADIQALLERARETVPEDEAADAQLAELAKEGPLQTTQILAVQKPEAQGGAAIAGMITVCNPRFFSTLGEVAGRETEEQIESYMLFMALLYWVRGVPPWGAQLASLGLTPEDCDLVDDAMGLLGDPKANRWDVKQEWLVAALRGNGEWGILPTIGGGTIHNCSVDALAREALFRMVMGGTGNQTDHDLFRDHPPWISPRPSLTDINYVRWSAVETDPAKCPKCGEYVRFKWRYCPYCGVKLDTDHPAPPGDSDQTPGR
jgi:hypothetical protein